MVKKGGLLKTTVRRVISARHFFRRSSLANALREASYVHNSPFCWGPPKIREIEITSCCPAQCIMCPRRYIFSRAQSHMPLDLFRQIIEQVKPWYQVDFINCPPVIRLFHYGEPCLCPHFYEAIKICKQRGFYVIISSIASLFTPERAKEAIEAGLDEVWLMFDGMDEETSTKIRGKVASFEKSLANIHTLLELKQAKGVKHPLAQVSMIRQPANAHQWAQFKQYWDKVTGVKPYLAYLSNFGGNVAEINLLLKELQSMNGQPEEDERVQRLNRYRCFYPWQSVSILSDGRVVPCCRDMNGTYVLGDLHHKSLAEIWNDEPIQNLRAECISGRVTNPLCISCTGANNEIDLPVRFYPEFRIMDYFFPQRYRRFKNVAMR